MTNVLLVTSSESKALERDEIEEELESLELVSELSVESLLRLLSVDIDEGEDVSEISDTLEAELSVSVVKLLSVLPLEELSEDSELSDSDEAVDKDSDEIEDQVELELLLELKVDLELSLTLDKLELSELSLRLECEDIDSELEELDSLLPVELVETVLKVS
jgi:hypothetical protein